MRRIYLTFWVFIALLVVSFPLYGETDLHNPSVSILSLVEEREMGKAFMQEVRKHFVLVQDPVVNSYLQQLGNRLVTAAPNKKYRQFRFFIIKDSNINAFAGPDGYIGVNSGLILATHSESELASVMAHEITHITQNHLMRRMQQAKQQNITSIGTMLAAVLIGSVTNSAVGSGAMMAAMGSNVQEALNFSRSHEQEADRIGIRTLYDAGFAPQAMVDFFKTMQKSTFNYKYQAPEFMLTHPLTESRMADLKNRVAQLPPRSDASPEIYYLVREKLRVDNAPIGHQIIDYYQEMLASKRYDNKNAFDYGYALALIKNHQYAKAQQSMQRLVSIDAKQPVYQMTLAEIELKTQQSALALKTLKASMALNPTYYPLQMQYANALLSAGQPAQARYVLRKIVRRHPENLTALEMLARAAGNSGDLAEAYEARSQLYAAVGNFKMAKFQLEQAQRLPNLDQNNRLILEAKLSQLKTQMPKE